jgi:hypothetical protein
MDNHRRRLLARREDVRRHLEELSKGAAGRGSSPARRRTSAQMLRYLLDDIEKKLEADEKQERP